MKNIHVIATGEASRLCNDEFGEFYLTKLMESKNSFFKNQNIYITSDEEIKEGDWFLGLQNQMSKSTSRDIYGGYERKIILTTDLDLIKDGVQPIDDEFLEWFCSKNGVVDFVKVITIEDEEN